LGSTAEQRALQYRDLARSAIPEGEWALICEALHREQLTGGERFSDQVEGTIKRRIESRVRSRPRKRGVNEGKKYIEQQIRPFFLPRRGLGGLLGPGVGHRRARDRQSHSQQRGAGRLV
jgi:hypothetical protein